MTFKNTFLIFSFLITTLHLFAQQCADAEVVLHQLPARNNGEYRLVFEDNFNGKQLDISKWTPFTGVPRDYNFEQQKAWHQPENIEISDGTLKIIAKKYPKPHNGTWVTDWSTKPFTKKTDSFNYSTGEMWSKRKFFYGKYEIRCRLPEGKGLWPAFWTYGGKRWNEIDFFEIYGDDIDRYTCNIHYDFHGNGGSESCRFAKNKAADFTQWHTFTCIFEFDRMIFQIDGKTIRTYYRFSDKKGNPILAGKNDTVIGKCFQKKAFPIESMYLVLNMAIQNGKNAPDEKTKFPAKYEVDYVRYYAKVNDLKNSKPPKIEILPPSATISKKNQYFGIVAGYNIGRFLNFSKVDYYDAHYNFKSGVGITAFYEETIQPKSSFRIGLQYNYQKADLKIRINGSNSSYTYMRYDFQHIKLNLHYAYQLIDEKKIGLQVFIGPTFSYNFKTIATGNGWDFYAKNQIDTAGNTVYFTTTKDWQKNNQKVKDISSFSAGADIGFNAFFPLNKKVDLVVQNKYNILLSNIIKIDDYRPTSFFSIYLNLGLRFKI